VPRKRYLLKNQYFINDFDIIYISSYISIDIGFTDENIYNLKNCDLLISQFVSDKQNEYSSNFIIKNMIKNECKVIILQYYRFFGYWFSKLESTKWGGRHPSIFRHGIPLLKDININYSNYEKYIEELLSDKIYDNDIKEYNNNLDEAFKFFIDNENTSTIKMIDYIKNNYKKYKLFVNQDHPSTLFFCELVNRISNYLNYNYIVEPFNDNILDTYEYPISNKCKKILELEFDNKYINFHNIRMSQYQWYMIYIKLNFFKEYEEPIQKIEIFKDFFIKIFN
jgi:hypothetical protein